MDFIMTTYKKIRLGPEEETDLRLVINSKDFEDYTDQGGMLRNYIDYWFIKARIKK